MGRRNFFWLFVVVTSKQVTTFTSGIRVKGFLEFRQKYYSKNKKPHLEEFMKKFGKLALLLVVFGWFCPVGCNLSGPKWIEIIYEGEAGVLAFFAAMLALSMIAALVGLILFLVSLVKKQENKDKIATTVVSLCLGAPFILLAAWSGFGDSGSFPDWNRGLNFGGYIMLTGWIISLFLLIKAKKENHKLD